MAQAASAVACCSGNSLNGHSSSALNDEPTTKASLKEIFDTMCHCIICTRTPTEAVLCPHCSRMFCSGCYRTRRKCPYCFEKVTKNGLLKCRWVGELIQNLESVLNADWGAGNPRREVVELLDKAGDNLKCPVCYETVMDAVLCPHCSKMFCGRCIKVWVISRNQSCPCCVVAMTENDLITCHWGENLGKIVDKLLGKPPRVANGNTDNFLDDTLAQNEEETVELPVPALDSSDDSFQGVFPDPRVLNNILNNDDLGSSSSEENYDPDEEGVGEDEFPDIEVDSSSDDAAPRLSSDSDDVGSLMDFIPCSEDGSDFEPGASDVTDDGDGDEEEEEEEEEVDVDLDEGPDVEPLPPASENDNASSSSSSDDENVNDDEDVPVLLSSSDDDGMDDEDDDAHDADSEFESMSDSD